MNIQSIKQLVEQYTPAELHQAERDLTEERPLAISVQGEDEGEQLTHILAAIWVCEHMQQNNADIMKAIREYGKRVRESLS
ncbi:MAG: hypothetical protein SGJ05_06955 [bacterium]|nr:hypothetical protein [bacterium]